MTIHFVYFVLPAFVTWTDDIGADNRAAVTNGFRIRMRPKYRYDAGIMQHELQHVRQFYRGLIPFCGMMHLEREIEAYRVQLRYYPEDDTAEKRDARITLFASFLANGYPDFSITQEEAQRVLQNAASGV